MIKTFEAVMKDLKANKYEPVYLLQGEESYYIDKITDFIENNALPESERGFNQVVLYGKDVTSGDIINQAKRFPMMAEKQVVIVKEMNQLEELSKDGDHVIFWEKYLKKPLKTTILVLAHKHKTISKTTKLGKLFDKSENVTIVETKKLYDNQIPSWAIHYLADKKYKIEPKAAQMLAEFLGSDLSKLVGELDKLMLNIPASQVIKEEDIEKFVGISKDYNIFELQKALIEKNTLKTFKIIEYWEANPKKQPLILTISMLFGFFSKVLLTNQDKEKNDSNLGKLLGVSHYMLKDYKQAAQTYKLPATLKALEYIYEADLQSKGLLPKPETDAEILKELVFKILYL
jgi:DNA polymerase-3 subunit delta